MKAGRIARVTGVARDTVRRLNRLLGQVCHRLPDATIRDLQVPFIQIDEMWAFIQ